MGIWGLNSYSKKYRVNISNEVESWKRKHVGETPKIVIDFLNLTYRVAQNDIGAICGGRHQNVMREWKQLLDAFKVIECSLVFFSDLNTLEGKKETWMKRRDCDFNQYAELYRLMNNRQSIQIRKLKSLNWTSYDMVKMAQEYGEFHYSVKHENDSEIVKYANENNALAIISNDSDFLIFEGSWKLWSVDGINFNPLETQEFNRNGLLTTLGLSRHQMPLFATLMGNDVTKDQLKILKKELNYSGDFGEVARFVRTIRIGEDHSYDIECVFSNLSGEMKKLIRDGLDSYNIDFPPATVDEPIERELLENNSKTYRSYMALISPIMGISMPYYDLVITNAEISLPELIIKWTRRKVGILLNHKKHEENHKFTVLAKKTIEGAFTAYEETPFYPDCAVPPLNELYISGRNDVDAIETKWELFRFIMSFPEDIIPMIKQLDKSFRLICATLYVLVETKLIIEEEADGILYTEYRVRSGRSTGSASYSDIPEAQSVRAAHIYNIAFSHVRENFIIAGLLGEIEDELRFDGVYFQNIMRISKSDRIEDMKIHKAIKESIKKLRTYATIN